MKVQVEVAMSEIIRRTISRLREQDGLPPSPCDVDSSGEVRLCAGAIHVREALEAMVSEAAATEFVDELLETRDKRLIISVGSELGIPAEVLQTDIMINDARAGSASDSEELIRYFETLLPAGE